MNKFKYQKIYGRLSWKLVPLYEIFKQTTDAQHRQKDVISDDMMKSQIKELSNIIKKRQETLIPQIEAITLKPFCLTNEITFIEKMLPPYHSISRPLMIDCYYSWIEQFYIYLQAIVRHQLLVYYPNIHKIETWHELFTSLYSSNSGEIKILHMRGLIITTHLAAKRWEGEVLKNMYKDRWYNSLFKIHQRYIDSHWNDSAFFVLQNLIKTQSQDNWLHDTKL
jgi:hypothetical protein